MCSLHHSLTCGANEPTWSGLDVCSLGWAWPICAGTGWLGPFGISKTWVVSRATADITDYTKYSTSSSCFASYVNHCAVINGTQYPTAQISTLSEAAEESFKVANIYKKQTPKGSQQGGIINRGQMIAAEGTAAGASLCLSVNLSKTGADESMFGSGLDLSTSNSPNVFQVSYTPANASTVTVWVLSQSLLHINGMGQFSTEI